MEVVDPDHSSFAPTCFLSQDDMTGLDESSTLRLPCTPHKPVSLLILLCFPQPPDCFSTPTSSQHLKPVLLQLKMQQADLGSLVVPQPSSTLVIVDMASRGSEAYPCLSWGWFPIPCQAQGQTASVRGLLHRLMTLFTQR